MDDSEDQEEYVALKQIYDSQYEEGENLLTNFQGTMLSKGNLINK